MNVDWSAVARGVFAGAAIAVPARLLADAVSEGSSLRSLLSGVIVVAFVFGGYIAGQARPARGITHGGIAGLLAALPVLVVGIALAGRVGASVIFSPLLGGCCGVLGGYAAFRRSLTTDDTPAASR